MPNNRETYAKRVKWFHQARFGIFIHWGLYSLLEHGEWVMLQERIRAGEYARLSKRFRPAKFDAKSWASLIVESGAKYAVLTTRHHDGFCLFDSKVSEFTSVKSAAGRDFVAEFAGACRKAGLKVGLYYSLLDWRFPGYAEPEKYGDSAEAMVEQAHQQVRELMSNYGKIDLLWYDGDWIYHEKNREANAVFWNSRKLNAMVRRLQPHILINNRSGLDEDFDTPEQHVAASKPGRAWESCMTMGDECGWGYIRHNPNFKTVPQLLQHLVSTAAREGNFLLNIGPRADGSVRSEEVVRLREIGRWLGTNAEAIYGSQRCDLLDRPKSHKEPGMWSSKGNVGYLHVFRWPGQEAVLPLIKTKALSATILETRQRARIRQEYNGRLVIHGLPRKPPHPYVTVIKVRFASKPQMLKQRDKAAWITGEL